MLPLSLRAALTAALALVLSALAPVPTAEAAVNDVYVSKTGTDAGTCESAAPCATFAYALGQVNAGGTLHIAPGNYTGTFLSTTMSALTIEGTGSTPGAVVLGNLFLGTASTEFYTLRNLRVESNVASTLISSDAQNVTVEDAELSMTGGGNGQFFMALRPGGGNFEDITLRRVKATTDRSLASIQLDGDLLIEDSTITNTAPNNGSTVGFSSGDPTVTVRRSTITQTASDFDLISVLAGSNGAGDVTVDSSLLIGGRAVIGTSATSATSSKVLVKVTNSTLIGYSSSIYANRQDLQSAEVTTTVDSSILAPRPSEGFDDGGYVNTTCTYSAVGANAALGTPSVCAAGGNNPTYNDSTFWGLAGQCCQPGPGSAVIDAGNPAALTGAESATDLAGRDRQLPGDGSCSGGRRDIGAYEFYDASKITPMITPPANVKKGKAAQFSATSDKPGATFEWDFGDSGTGTGSPVSHTFATTGSKTVTVTATSGQCTGEATTVVNVLNPDGSNPTGLQLTAKLKKAKVVKGKAAKLTVTLSAAAKVSVVATPKKGGKTKKLIKGQALKKGANKLKLATKKLKPGKYVLTISSGSVKKTVKLKVLAPRKK